VTDDTVSAIEQLSCDVLVIGAGTAGSVAALAAAEEGAAVILLELGSIIGGMGSAGGVHGYHYGLETGMFPRLDSAAEGMSQTLAGRVSHPDGKRFVLARSIQDAGVLFISGLPYAVFQDGDRRVKGVLAETDRGSIGIAAKVTVDSTGDADIATLAGASHRYGREWDGLPNGYSLLARTVADQGRVVSKGGDTGWVDTRDPWDVTRAYLYGRKRLWSRLAQQPDPSLLAFCPTLSLRAGRYIEGDYTLTLDDLLSGQTFNDAIAMCYSNYDPHALDYANESELTWVWACVCGLWGIPLACQIPYRCLIPAGVDGMLIASRAISLTSDVAMAVRMQRDLQNIGEAAGVAAALCAREGTSPRFLDVQVLQERLEARGLVFDMSRLSQLPTGKGRTKWLAGAPSDRVEDENVLDYLATPDEPISMAWWYRDESDILELLGTPYEGKALWHIYKHPGEFESDLLRLVDDGDLRRRRAAAFALALVDHPAGWPEVIESIRRRDPDILPGRRTHARWIGGLALVALQAPLCAADCMLDVLAVYDTPEFTEYLRQSEELTAKERVLTIALTRTPDWIDPVSRAIGAMMFALRYFYKVLEQLSPDQRKRLGEVLEGLIIGKIGDHFRNFSFAPESVSWSLDTSAAGLLVRLNHPLGSKTLEHYLEDDRAYVRNAALMRRTEVL
jgi:hypothetical protein